MKRRIKILCIIIPVCLCALLIIANLIQYFHFYRVLNEIYETCKKIPDSMMDWHLWNIPIIWKRIVC